MTGKVTRSSFVRQPWRDDGTGFVESQRRSRVEVHLTHWKKPDWRIRGDHGAEPAVASAMIRVMSMWYRCAFKATCNVQTGRGPHDKERPSLDLVERRARYSPKIPMVASWQPPKKLMQISKEDQPPTVGPSSSCEQRVKSPNAKLAVMTTKPKAATSRRGYKLNVATPSRADGGCGPRYFFGYPAAAGRCLEVMLVGETPATV